MGNIGDTPNLNSDDENERIESDEDDEESSTMEQAQPIVRESTGSSQPTTGVISNDTTDHITDVLMVSDFANDASSLHFTLPSRYCGININFYWYWLMSLLMGLTIGHSLYWFIFVSIGLAIYMIDLLQFPEWTYNNRFRVQLGNTEPCPSVDILGLHQGGQGAARIAQPFESWQPVIITWPLSRTITEYFPFPRESIPTEDSQPSTMPAPIVLNSIGRSHLANNENTHPNTGETTQNIRDELMTPSVFIETQSIVVGNAATGIPKEISRDFEFSVSTNERQNGNESDTSSDDEQLLRHESSPYVRGGNDDELTCNIDQRAEVSSNTKIIPVIDRNNTSPNQANVVDEHGIVTTSGTDSPPSRGPETERSVDAPTEDGSSMIFTALDPAIINVPKQRTPSSSSDEFIAEINT